MPCPNCGAGDEREGPVHPYMASSPGCWAAFGELQADEAARFGYPPVHGLAVDADAASHGGDGRQRRDRQSVAIHLAGLFAVLEQGYDSRRRMALLQRLPRVQRDWPALERPPGRPALNLEHASGSADVDDYERRVHEWAGAVWEFWSPEHPRVRGWLP